MFDYMFSCCEKVDLEICQNASFHVFLFVFGFGESVWSGCVVVQNAVEDYFCSNVLLNEADRWVVYYNKKGTVTEIHCIYTIMYLTNNIYSTCDVTRVISQDWLTV